MHKYLVDDKKYQIISEHAPVCANRSCSRREVEEPTDRALYKTCHYCVTFYCSRECRVNDWGRHKETECQSGRMASYCKKILARLSNNLQIREELSRIAIGSFRNSHKRGFVWLDFSSSHVAFDFYRSLSSDADHLKPDTVGVLSPLENLFLKYFGDFFLPIYVSCHDVEKLANNDSYNILAMLFTDEARVQLDELTRLIRDYEPTREFILLVSIRLPNVNGQSFAVKFIKLNLRLKNSNHCEAGPKDELPLTVILTSLHKSDQQSERRKEDDEESRQLFLANLVNEFEMRGINLRERYPKIYTNLCLYVEENRPFTPVCLFPRDLNKNNLFMCLIMPNSEPVGDYAFDDSVAKSSNHETEKQQQQQPLDYDEASYLCIY